MQVREANACYELVYGEAFPLVKGSNVQMHKFTLCIMVHGQK